MIFLYLLSLYNFRKNAIVMSVLRLLPVLQRPEVVLSVPRLSLGCSGFTKLVSSISCRHYGSNPNPKVQSPNGKDDKLQISYHNGNTVANPVRGVVFDLQFDTPPVLFIKKYKQVIDTTDIVFSDELNDLEKCGDITPKTLTQQKIKYIQDAIKLSKTFEALKLNFKKKPDPILSAKVSEGEVQRSVFTDSDFENIRVESVQGLRQKPEVEFEWTPTKLELASLPNQYLMLSKVNNKKLIFFKNLPLDP